MAKILFKRGLTANLPAVLDVGEPAFTTDTKKLYVGTGSDKVQINPDTVPSAAKLADSRTIGIVSDDLDASGASANFDGSGDIELRLNLKNIVTAGTYPKITYDAMGRVTGGTALTSADIPSIPSSKVTGLGTAAALNSGTATGNVPVLDSSGKLTTSVLPALAINDTFTVGGESAMLSLTAQRGDIAVRSDLSKCFILTTDDPTALANWKQLLTPPDAVLSVAGKTGAVSLSVSDISGAAPLASPALTGTPTAPTAATGTNTAQIATTAFVLAQIAASTIDGGTF